MHRCYTRHFSPPQAVKGLARETRLHDDDDDDDDVIDQRCGSYSEGLVLRLEMKLVGLSNHACRRIGQQTQTKPLG